MIKNFSFLFVIILCFPHYLFSNARDPLPSFQKNLLTDEEAFSVTKKTEHTPFFVQDGDNKLLGVIYKPIQTKCKKLPIIIFCHGLNDSKYGKQGGFVRLAERISREGFVVVRFDFQGCGESEGCWSHNLISNFDNNFHCVLNYIRSLSYVDENNIAIFGHSLGCHTAIIGASNNSCIKTVVLWAPVSNALLWSHDFLNAFSPSNNIYNDLSLPIDEDITNFRYAFASEFLSLEDASLLKQLPLHFSVLHLHGTEDNVTLFHHQSVFMYENAQSARKIKYKTLKEAKHTVADCPNLSEVEQDIILWLKEELQ